MLLHVGIRGMGCGKGEGVRTLPSVFMKNVSASLEVWGWPPNLPLLLQLRIIFFTTKRHSQKIKKLLVDYRLFSFKLNN